MTAMRNSFPVISLAAALMASAAQAETRASADLSFDGGYSSNLYLQEVSNAGTASASFRLAPQINIRGPKSDIVISGTLNQNFYSKYYSNTTNWSLRAASQFRLSELSSLSLNANYSDEVSSALTTDAIEVLPGEPGSAPLPDPTVVNLAGQRRKAIAGGASFQTQLSPRTSMSFSASASNLEYADNSAAGYLTVGGSAGVSHTINEGFSAGASLSYSRTDYDNALYGEGTYISPQLNATISLSPRVRLSVSGGATFSDSSGQIGGGKRTSFSGSMSLCRNGVRGSGCINAVRSSGAASQVGDSTNTAFGADYNYQLTPRSSISMGAQYSTNRSTTLGALVDTRYATARAEYSRQINERLSFSLKANYTKSLESVTTRAASYFGGVSISYRLG